MKTAKCSTCEKLKKKEKKTEVIIFRITLAQKKLIEKLKLNVSEICRQAIAQEICKMK